MSTYKYDKTTGELTKIAGGTLYADTPVGTIQAYGGSTFPDGWLLCDGTELNRTDYPDLFAVIGTSFGTPSANTKFKLPDLRESTLKGTGLTSKSNNHYDSDGLALGEFIDDRVQVHRHYAFNGNYNGWNLYFSNISEGKVVRGDSTDYNNGKSTGEMTTGRTGATTEVKAVGVNFIIKAKKVGAPADLIDGVKNSADTTPTLNSTNLITSGGVYNALSPVGDCLTYALGSWEVDAGVTDVKKICTMTKGKWMIFFSSLGMIGEMYLSLGNNTNTVTSCIRTRSYETPPISFESTPMGIGYVHITDSSATKDLYAHVTAPENNGYAINNDSRYHYVKLIRIG